MKLYIIKHYLEISSLDLWISCSLDCNSRRNPEEISCNLSFSFCTASYFEINSLFLFNVMKINETLQFCVIITCTKFVHEYQHIWMRLRTFLNSFLNKQLCISWIIFSFSINNISWLSHNFDQWHRENSQTFGIIIWGEKLNKIIINRTISTLNFYYLQ